VREKNVLNKLEYIVYLRFKLLYQQISSQNFIVLKLSFSPQKK